MTDAVVVHNLGVVARLSNDEAESALCPFDETVSENDEEVAQAERYQAVGAGRGGARSRPRRGEDVER